MESTFQAFKRPSSNGRENNALVRRMHHEKQEKKFWTPSEDLKLTELVATYGARRWNRLAEKMQGRTGKGCRIRWLNKLDPRINKTAFTDEEDAKILSAQRELGNQWTKIAKLLHRRTDIAVRNQWRHLNTKKLKKQTKDETTNLKPPSSASSSSSSSSPSEEKDTMEVIS